MYFNFVIQFFHWKAPDGDVLNKCMYVFVMTIHISNSFYMQMINVSNHTNKSTSKEINWSTHEHPAVVATLIALR